MPNGALILTYYVNSSINQESVDCAKTLFRLEKSTISRGKTVIAPIVTFTALRQWLVPAVADEPTTYVVFLCP